MLNNNQNPLDAFTASAGNTLAEIAAGAGLSVFAINQLRNFGANPAFDIVSLMVVAAVMQSSPTILFGGALGLASQSSASRGLILPAMAIAGCYFASNHAGPVVNYAMDSVAGAASNYIRKNIPFANLLMPQEVQLPQR
jgi:hypothetical protein